MDLTKAEDTALWLENELGVEVIDRSYRGASQRPLEDYDAFTEALRGGAAQAHRRPRTAPPGGERDRPQDAGRQVPLRPPVAVAQRAPTGAGGDRRTDGGIDGQHRRQRRTASTPPWVEVVAG
jgi:hypothetical protein